MPIMADELSALPQHLTTGLLELVEVLGRKGIRYALIGGVATSYRSRPRFTRDLDFILEVPQLALPALLDELHERGDGRPHGRDHQQQLLSIPMGAGNHGRAQGRSPIRARHENRSRA